MSRIAFAYGATLAIALALFVPGLAFAQGGGLQAGTASQFDVSNAVVTGLSNVVYTGKAFEPAVTVTLDGKVLSSGDDYEVSYEDNVDAGTAKVTVEGTGSYTGSITKTFTIAKAENRNIAQVTRWFLTKNQIKNKIGYTLGFNMAEDAKVTYKVVSMPAKAKKYVKLKSSGKLNFKKGLKNGTYKIKIRVSAAATKNYLKTERYTTLKLTVKKQMQRYRSLDKLGISAESSADAKVNCACDNMIALLRNNGTKFSKLSSLDKAHAITGYIGSHYYYRTGSYTAASMVKKGYGTCFAYSDLTYCMAKKLGFKKVWLTVPGRNVNHGGKYYGSQHRSVVAKIGKKYYELDSNASFISMVWGGDAPAPERISASYARYLIGKAKKYKSIH